MALGLDKQTLIIISIVLFIGIAIAIGQILFLTLTSCRNKNDIMFMMDDSSSINNEDFNKVKDFVVTIANSKGITLSENKANIVAGSFAKQAQFMDKFPEDHYMFNAEVIKNQMDNYVRQACSSSSGFFVKVEDRACTNTIAGLDFVSSDMIRDRKGFKTLIFMTDGGSNMEGKRQDLNQIKKSADSIKDQGVTVYTISVDDPDRNADYKIEDQKELSVIASGNTDAEKQNYMFQVKYFNELDQLALELGDQLCSKNYWLVAIPLTVALVFVIIKLTLNYCEHKKFQQEEAEAATLNRTELK